MPRSMFTLRICLTSFLALWMLGCATRPEFRGQPNRKKTVRKVVKRVVEKPVTEELPSVNWEAVHLKELAGFGFNWPESVLPLRDGRAIVSNIDSLDREGWTEDGLGFLSLIDVENEVKKLNWIDRVGDVKFDAPKGMEVIAGRLYVADVSRLLRIIMGKDGKPATCVVLPIPGARRLNDLAGEGNTLYISDTEKGLVYALNTETGDLKNLLGPPGVNGITVYHGKLLAVSVTEGEVYEIDKKGEKAARAFGLSKYFVGLDGIEVMRDGSLIVSDVRGGRVCAINKDLSRITTLIKLEWPADIGINRETDVLYVPQLKLNKIQIFQLRPAAQAEPDAEQGPGLKELMKR